MNGHRLLALLLLALPLPAAAQWTSGIHDTDVVRFEVSDFGKLGSWQYDLGGPEGFVFGGENGLYEGALLVGLNPEQVSGAIYEKGTGDNYEWTPLAPVSEVTPPDGFDQAFETVYDDSVADDPIGLEVTQRSYSRDGDPFILVALAIENTSGDDLAGLYPGIFADWDVDFTYYGENLCDYDEATHLLYCWGTAGSNPNYYGIAVLGAPQGATVTGTTYDVLPGDAVLYDALTTRQPPPIVPTDVRTVLGVGPLDLAAGERRTVAFAFVGGASEAEILAHAEDAREAFLTLTPNEPESVPSGVTLHAPSPNPARGAATLAFTLDRPQPVRLAVYDALGREVAVLMEGEQGAGRHALAWDAGALPAGLYTVRLVAGGVGLTRRVALVR